MKTLQSYFAQDISLRDWEINEQGINNVVQANTTIFNNVDSIKVKPKNIFESGSIIIAELVITINDSESLLVVDIIEFNENGLINAIRAYKG